MPVSDQSQRLADKLGIPDIDDFAEPLSWLHIESQCKNCDRPIFTNSKVSPRTQQQDVWRHQDNGRQECIRSDT